MWKLAFEISASRASDGLALKCAMSHYEERAMSALRSVSSLQCLKAEFGRRRVKRAGLKL
jgi:hypothetical protein